MPRSQQNNVSTPILLTPEFMREWPLPVPEGEADKNARGQILVVGGAQQMPGAIILAATGALRAGAGKLQIATGRSIAPFIAMSVPESLVYYLPETKAGGISAAAAEEVAVCANKADATLIGPGMMDSTAVQRLMGRLLPGIEDTVLVLDALAMETAVQMPALLHGLGGQVILTPHAGEMASMLDLDKQAVQDDPWSTVRRAATEFQAVVALKGAETRIATPDGQMYHFHSHNIGMATSGSGDTLAGIVAGLAARGATPVQALAWGVYLHGTAGDKLAERMGRLGFLARELLAEVPSIMADFDPTDQD